MTKVQLDQMLRLEKHPFSIINEELDLNIYKVVSDHILQIDETLMDKKLVLTNLVLRMNEDGLQEILGYYIIPEGKYAMILFESLMKNNEVEDMSIIKVGVF